MSDLQFQSKHSVEVSPSTEVSNLNTFSYLSNRTVLPNNSNKSISTHSAVAVEEEVTVGELKSRKYVFDIPNKGQYLMSAVLQIEGHTMEGTVSDHIERIELLQNSNRNVLLERLDNANLHPTTDAKMVEDTYSTMNMVKDTIFYPLNFFFSEKFRHLLLGKSTFSICVKFYDNSKVKDAVLSLRTSHVYLPFGEVDSALSGIKQTGSAVSQNKIPFNARTSLYYKLEGLTDATRTYRLDIGDLGNHLKSFNVTSEALTDTSMLTLSTNKNGTNPIVQQPFQYFKLQSLLAGHAAPGFHFDLVDELVPILANDDDNSLIGGPILRVGGGAIDLSTQKLFLHITGLDESVGAAEHKLRLDVVHEECLHRDSYGMFYSSQNFLSDGISSTEPMSLETA